MAAGIYRRGTASDAWTIVFDGPEVPGRPRNQKSVAFRGTFKEAKAHRVALIKSVNDGAYREPTNWTVERLLKEWMAVYAEQQHEVNTYRRNESFIRVHIVPGVGDQRIDRLTGLELDHFYRRLRERGSPGGKGPVGPRTVRQIHAVLTSALRWGVKKKLLSRNPAEDADPLEMKEKRFTPLDEDGIRRLLSITVGTSVHTPVLLAAYTGMRQGEIAALRWDAVDLEGKTLTVCRSAHQVPRGVREWSGVGGEMSKKLGEARGNTREKGTKNGDTRAVPIPADLLAELTRVKSQQAAVRLALGITDKSEWWVAGHEDGSPRSPGAIAQAFRKLARRHKVPTHFHGLRHAFASLLGATGTTPSEAAELLGHRRVDMTFHYSHGYDSRKRDAMARLNAALSPTGSDR